jgi:hypothetical protein
MNNSGVQIITSMAWSDPRDFVKETSEKEVWSLQRAEKLRRARSRTVSS